MSTNEVASADPARLRQLADMVGYFLESDVCALYGVTKMTALNWRKRHQGPPYVLAGCTPLYPREGVIRDLASRIRERNTPSGKDAL